MNLCCIEGGQVHFSEFASIHTIQMVRVMSRLGTLQDVLLCRKAFSRPLVYIGTVSSSCHLLRSASSALCLSFPCLLAVHERSPGMLAKTLSAGAQVCLKHTDLMNSRLSAAHALVCVMCAGHLKLSATVHQYLCLMRCIQDAH